MDLTSKFLLMVLCVTGLLYETSKSERAFAILPPPGERDVVKETLVDLQAPKERLPFLSKWITSASAVTRLDPILLCCLLHTESRFKKDAVSEKGYKGEAQTKRFSQYSSVNILEGAETLRDKLSLSNGNMLEAIARYKGGKDKVEAREEATRVLRLYESQLVRRGLWSQ
jgi:soluble lytic murein transglycosylase-like protein